MDSQGKSLTKAEQRLERVREIRDSIAEKAMGVIATATEAHYYDDDIDPNIVTEEELEKWGSVREAKAKKRLIRDLRKNRAEAPVYLAESREIVKSYERIISAQRGDSGNTLNIAVFIQDKRNDPTVAKEATYEIIDVTGEDDDE
jgi:hypothetical protein